MKTVSLKITAAERKRREKEMKDSPSISGSPDEYPWGMRLTISDDTLKKFPGLMSVGAGDTLTFTGKVRVKEVAVTDRDNEKKNQRVELQITDLGFEENEDALDEDFESDD